MKMELIRKKWEDTTSRSDNDYDDNETPGEDDDDGEDTEEREM